MFDFSAVFTGSGLVQLAQVVIGDLTMAGDNVVIIGSLAAGLPDKDRKRVLMLGVGIALIFLILFAIVATQLLKLTGLVFAGGLLLLWVGYNMARELRHKRAPAAGAEALAGKGLRAHRSFLRAVISITLADLSMSLDNVLLVASIARQNPALLIFGLGLSVLLMGVAANYVARLIQRFHWIGWIGLAVILYVACSMIYEGWIGGDHVLGLRTLLHL